jgi:cytochrome P450
MKKVKSSESVISAKNLPRPRTPQFWRMLKLVFRPVDYLEDYGQQYGDFFAVGNPETPFVYVNHPQAIAEIFTAKSSYFESGRGNGILKYMLGNSSLVLLDGEAHQQKRKLLRAPFQGERLQDYYQKIVNITQEVTQSWTSGTSFRVRDILQEITLKVILEVVFGLTKGVRYERLQQLLTTLLESLNSPFSSSVLFFEFLRQDWGKWSPWGRFLEMKSQIDRLLIKEIEERRQKKNEGGEDILSWLISARDESGEGMTSSELRDQLMTLLVAGHETTASALTWALYWIHFLPQVEEKLRRELKTVDNCFSFESIKSLSYLDAVCKETLRIYPVTMTTFPRILKNSLEVMGYHFPAQTVLMPCIYLVHHREDIYPQANQFKPERFLERQFSAYEYLPFGGGNRRCLGSGLAILEMKAVLTTILSQFTLQLVHSRLLKPVRRGLTLAAPSNLKMKVRDLTYTS